MGTAEEPEQDAQKQDAQEYVAKLRSAPAEQLVTEVLFTLLNTAQVKLGRRDARLFIDLSALVHEHSRRHVSGELTKQVDHALGQLRLAQVRAEGEASRQGVAAEPNDLAETPAPPAGRSPDAPPQQQPAPQQAPQPPPASKLWVPGRDF
jgi:hypothetical protein